MHQLKMGIHMAGSVEELKSTFRKCRCHLGLQRIYVEYARELDDGEHPKLVMQPIEITVDQSRVTGSSPFIILTDQRVIVCETGQAAREASESKIAKFTSIAISDISVLSPMSKGRFSIKAQSGSVINVRNHTWAGPALKKWGIKLYEELRQQVS
jgi:hypothetical protein